MDEIFKAVLAIGAFVGTGGMALKYFSHLGRKYENAAANMRGDVRAIEAQETLNQNLAETIGSQRETINQLTERLEHERQSTDQWRDRYYALLSEKATAGRQS